MDDLIRQQSFQRIPRDQGLYRFENEHDACGVGLVADLNNIPSHKIVEMGMTILKRLMHRGASGGDPNTGDGAGLLLGIPDEFFRTVLKSELPPKGKYGVAMIFGGLNMEPEIERIVTSCGCKVMEWRDVPVNPDMIGEAARETCPLIRQLFIGGAHFSDSAAFERKLFVIRRLIEKSLSGCYLCSCSCRSIVYKGLLLAPQLEKFYTDLASPAFKSTLALVHQRYSTNTFPAWNLAHPYRCLAHNGEINTLRGNLNHLRGREKQFSSELFGDDLKNVLPLIRDGQSDSACLDNMFELLVACGRSLPHAMLMLVPQAWGARYHLSRDVRGFFEYHSALMEPWDGPAAIAFSDGVNAGAILDRNGLRPARYTVTRENIFVLASETGVIDFPASEVVRKGRLKPGEIIYCDLENHRLLNDDEIKKQVARRRPYRRWCEENRITVHGLFDALKPPEPSPEVRAGQRFFGYSREDIEMIISPMARTGHEPVGSMGNDAALAVLSSQPQPLFHYFKQLFAQVTNPPIDPIREELVMSLTTYIGNQGNILTETPKHARLIKLPRPVLTPDELARLKMVHQPGFESCVLSLAFPLEGPETLLETALSKLCSDAVGAVREGKRILILSDRVLPENSAVIPPLLAVSAVNRALADAGLRPETGLIVESGEVREIMHFALLLGYGATAVCPWLALETVAELVHDKVVAFDKVTAAGNYINSVSKGLLKVMSKMGISTLRSYRSGQVFEAVGLDPALVDRYFHGTASRVGGIGLREIAMEARQRVLRSRNPEDPDLLPAGGQYKYRSNTENHLWTPQSLAAFRQAVQGNDAEKYSVYAKLINDQSGHLCTLRGLFEFKNTDVPLPLSDVESADSIMKRFFSGAMSLGSLSPEAHETIAVAMNRIGAMSNCGEGGEDPEREKPGPHGENRASAIHQIASGRFGVTINYLRKAKELQIKMAQGAKPGEGGQLPGHKVDEFVARLRHSMPHVTLISPPPHHDIYSIEDLAQLVYDLRSSNPNARVSVKLVSEVGVGTVAAGVAKAHADVILISGHDGGTGAAPLTSIKHAGLPWELGLAEAQQTLVLNHLRSRVRLQTDGQLKTGRDVVIAALLGAEEYVFATTILVCLGCVMMRKCHENTCPVGVATQDPELRKRFAGKPEYILNFLRFLAEEVRGYLAQLGLHSMDEAIGRSDLLKMNKAIDFYKARNLDFSGIFEHVGGGAVRNDPNDKPAPGGVYDRDHLLPELQSHIDDGSAAVLERKICNVDRSIGTALSGAVAWKYGTKGLPDDTLTVHFTGCAGQSFGAFLSQGITFLLTGEANDFVGKGLSGGRIVIRPPHDNPDFEPENNVIAGNVIGYGGTSGSIFLNGQAGERFAVRNSGVTAVVEGLGDHGCEYMTGGRVVVLGLTGNNFAAGMTGGLAYVYDEDNDFDLRCNVGTVDLENVDENDEVELLGLLREHLKYTGSPKAARILANWVDERHHFVKVFPVEYRQALGVMQREDAEAVDRRTQMN